MDKTKYFKICFSYLPYDETIRHHIEEVVRAQDMETALFVLGAGIKDNDLAQEADPNYSPVFHFSSGVKIESCFEITEFEAKRGLITIAENKNGEVGR